MVGFTLQEIETKQHDVAEAIRRLANHIDDGLVVATWFEFTNTSMTNPCTAGQFRIDYKMEAQDEEGDDLTVGGRGAHQAAHG